MTGPLAYNQKVIRDFRAHGGVVTEPDFPILLLTTSGARTGRRRTTPLAYTIDRDRVFVVASNAGAPTDPAWLHNVRGNPSVTVELGRDVFEARAIVVGGQERDRLVSIKAAQGPALGILQQRTTRQIPFVLLEGVPAPLQQGEPMKQSIALVTLGVSDYARAKDFYETLGWTVALDLEETAFFEANGVVLVLWARDKLAADMGIEDEGARWSGIMLAHNVGSRAEVDALIELARASGGAVTREPADTFYGGYAGGFRDPDGHAWEIAYNPTFGLTDDGSVILPRP